MELIFDTNNEKYLKSRFGGNYISITFPRLINNRKEDFILRIIEEYDVLVIEDIPEEFIEEAKKLIEFYFSNEESINVLKIGIYVKDDLIETCQSSWFAAMHVFGDRNQIENAINQKKNAYDYGFRIIQ